MTIRLLATYDGFSPNDIITLDSALETALIAGGNASATLTGGVVAYRERQPVMIQPATKRRGSVSLIANRKATVPLTEGSDLTIAPVAGTGTYQRRNATGAAVGALVTIGAGILTVGPFKGDFTVEIKCTTGAITAEVSDAVLTVGAPARTTPLRVVTSGDSTATVRGPKNPANQDVSVMEQPVWNSGTVDSQQDMDRFAMDQFYPQAYLVGAGGIIGDTTTQWLARDLAAASNTRYAISDMTALAPNLALVRIGINNGGALPNMAAVPAAVTTAFNEALTGVQRFIASGTVVFWEGLATSNAGSLNLAASQAFAVAYNALAAEYCAANPGMLAYIDPVGTISDATGAFLPYISDDGLHLSPYGQSQLGRLEAAAATRFFGPSVNARYQGKNLVANASFANVSAGSPVGFSMGVFNSTVANKKVEVIDGKPFYTGEFTITAASAQAQIMLPYDPTALSITAGDLYGFEVDFYLEGLNGYVPMSSGSFFRIDTRNAAGSGNVRFNRASFNRKGAFPGRWTGHLAWNPIKYGDSSANFLNTSAWMMTFFPMETAGTFKWGISSPRIVKLGQPVTTI